MLKLRLVNRSARSVLCTATLTLAVILFSHAHAEVVRPVDCYNASLRFAALLDVLRAEMGKPVMGRSPLQVQNAAPREVYFQTETTFIKINRLSFELTREEFPEPPTPPTEITPADVLVVIEASQVVLEGILSYFAIDQPAIDPPGIEDRTPTDVFNQFATINRQINQMLDQPFLPSDVYQRVTLCLNYTTALRANFPGPRIPETPPYEPRKKPADVYAELRQCFVLVREIATRSGLSTLSVNDPDEQLDATIAPGDVYDFSSLLLAELRYLQGKSDASAQPLESFYPGRKFPSHVHQRARLLLTQLTELKGLVDAEPDWLTTGEP